jgi:hypothetical protein
MRLSATEAAGRTADEDDSAAAAGSNAPISMQNRYRALAAQLLR